MFLFCKSHAIRRVYKALKAVNKVTKTKKRICILNTHSLFIYMIFSLNKKDY